MSRFNSTVAVLSGAVGIYSVVSESLFVFGIVCVGLVLIHLLVWTLKPRLLGPEYNHSAPFFAGVFGALAIAAFALMTLPAKLGFPEIASKDTQPEQSASSGARASFQEADFSTTRLEQTLGANLKPSSIRNPNTGKHDRGLLVTDVEAGGLLYNAGLRDGDLISEVASKDAISIDSVSTSFKNAVVLNRKSVLLYLWKGGGDAFVTLSLG